MGEHQQHAGTGWPRGCQGQMQATREEGSDCHGDYRAGCFRAYPRPERIKGAWRTREVVPLDAWGTGYPHGTEPAREQA